MEPEVPKGERRSEITTQGQSGLARSILRVMSRKASVVLEAVVVHVVVHELVLELALDAQVSSATRGSGAAAAACG